MAFRVNFGDTESYAEDRRSDISCVFCERSKEDDIPMKKLNSGISGKVLYACSICYRQLPEKKLAYDEESIRLTNALFIKGVDEW